MSVEQKLHFELHGWVKIPRAFTHSEMQEVAKMVDDISGWAPDAQRWMHHFETTHCGDKVLTRSENFLSYHPGMAQLLMLGRVPGYVADALGRDVFLYKEKINYKMPGGTGGYAAHQDAPAYKQIRLHCTALLSLDPARTNNGCLELVSGRHKEGIIGLTEDGVMSADSYQSMDFTPVETDPGDLVIFSSYTPHRSRANLSETSRRVLYLTYNAQEEGFLHEEYYRHKRASMQAGNLSLIKHFQGSMCPKDRLVADVADLYAERGATFYDQNVTQLEHALQSAALAEQQGAGDAAVVGALLHDIGHLLVDEHADKPDFLQSDHGHESVGSDWLQGRFAPEVVEPIRLHVTAKRYLCASRPGYWDGLSQNSKRSLELQGGPLSPAEAAEWIRQPHAESAVQLRLWDDQAKVPGRSTQDLDHFLRKAEAFVL